MHKLAIINKRLGGAVSAAALAISVLLAVACGEEPAKPRIFPWAEVAPFPDGATITAVADNGVGWVFACGSARDAVTGDNFATVYINVTELYRAPYAGSEFADMRAYDYERGWVVGRRPGGDGSRPFVVTYDRDGREFPEVDVPPSVKSSAFLKVYPESAERAWFQGDDMVYVYDHGGWRACGATAGADAGELVVTYAGRAYYLYRKGAETKLLISDDRGANWVPEPIRLNVGSYELDLTGALNIAQGNDDLYLAGTARSPVGPGSYVAVARRAGAAPGAGEFDLVFLAPAEKTPASFHMGFESTDYGFVVGDGFSYSSRGGGWGPDYLPPGLRLNFISVSEGSYHGSYAAAYYYAVPVGVKCSLFEARRSIL